MKKQFLYSVVLFNLLFVVSTYAQIAGPVNTGQNDEIAAGVVREINFVRSNPSAYAANLEAIKKFYRGNLYSAPGERRIQTFEGIAALDEAIQALRSAEPLPALTFSRGMSQAATDHVRDQGEKGLVNHKGTDGSSAAARINRYGNWLDGIGENINFGRYTPREIVIGFLIDDGVKSRGHRKNILKPAFSFIGTASGTHAKHGVMTVVDFADEYYESQPVQTAFSLQKAVLITEQVGKRSNRQK